MAVRSSLLAAFAFVVCGLPAEAQDRPGFQQATPAGPVYSLPYEPGAEFLVG